MQQEATTVRIGSALIQRIDRLRNYWFDGGRVGPEITRSQSVRYLADIGAQFEEIRLLDSYYPYSTEQALKLFADSIRRKPRTPTHVETESGRPNMGAPELDDAQEVTQ